MQVRRDEAAERRIGPSPPDAAAAFGPLRKLGGVLNEIDLLPPVPEVRMQGLELPKHRLEILPGKAKSAEVLEL